MSRRGVDLSATGNCPVADTCAWCGADKQLAVAALDTHLGVRCETLCAGCRRRGAPRDESRTRLSAGSTARRVLTHCEHLGIDLETMSTALEAEATRARRALR